MNNEVCIAKTLKKMKSNDFVLNCKMAQGYVYGYPILQIRNGSLCLKVPFLRYKVTGVPDKTLVFPIRYTISMELPEERYVDFTDLAYDNRFSEVDFNKAIGLFRHEAVKDLNKKQYEEKRSELFSIYDKLALSLLGEGEFTAEDDKRYRQLLRMLTEPSLLPIYKVLDKDFYEKYLRND